MLILQTPSKNGVGHVRCAHVPPLRCFMPSHGTHYMGHRQNTDSTWLIREFLCTPSPFTFYVSGTFAWKTFKTDLPLPALFAPPLCASLDSHRDLPTYLHYDREKKSSTSTSRWGEFSLQAKKPKQSVGPRSVFVIHRNALEQRPIVIRLAVKAVVLRSILWLVDHSGGMISVASTLNSGQYFLAKPTGFQLCCRAYRRGLAFFCP